MTALWVKSLPLIFCLSLASAEMRAERVTLRVGYFPNITHAQGVIGAHTTREKRLV